MRSILLSPLLLLTFFLPLNLQGAGDLPECKENDQCSSVANSETVRTIQFPLSRFVQQIKNKFGIRCRPYIHSFKKKNGEMEEISSAFPGKLTPFWAQEYIGSDLTHTFLKTVTKITKTGVGIVDSPVGKDAIPKEALFLQRIYGDHFRTMSLLGATDPLRKGIPVGKDKDHGDLSANLIYGNPPFGIAGNAYLTIHAGNPKAPTLTVPKLTRLINLSLGQGVLNLKDSVFEYATELSPEITSVFAAGNFGIFPSSMETHFVDRDNIVVVGSATATGLINSASTEGEQVTIVAPSDHKMVLSRDAFGPNFFGMTSAAAPMVTGALSNVLSICPKLKPKQLKTLLTQTATLLPSSREIPRRNGAGLLNAYKLARVAERVRSAMDNDQADVDTLLTEESLYDFSQEADGHFQNAMSIIRDYSDCESMQKVLLLLRESFLLHPTEGSRKALIATYTTLGLDLNKMFYQSLGSNEEVEDVVRTSLQMLRRDPKMAPIGVAGIRSLSYLPTQKERKELLDAYLYNIIGKEVELHEATRPDLFVATRTLSPEVYKDLPAEDKIKIARYLPEPSRTRALVKQLKVVCSTSYAKVQSFFEVNFKSPCFYYVAQLAKDKRKAFLIDNALSETPLLELLDEGLQLLNEEELDRFSPHLQSSSYPTDAKRIAIQFGAKRFDDETNQKVFKSIKKDPDLGIFFLLQNPAYDQSELSDLLKNSSDQFRDQSQEFFLFSYAQNLKENPRFINETQLNVFLDPTHAPEIATKIHSSELGNYLTKKALEAKDFNQSADYFLGAWTNAFLLGKKIDAISAQFESRWPKRAIDTRLLNDEQKAMLLDVKVFGKRIIQF